MEQIGLHCFPITSSDERAGQPFYHYTFGVPREGDYIEISLGHRLPGEDLGVLRNHLFKVIRVTWTSSEIKLLVIEDRALMSLA